MTLVLPTVMEHSQMLRPSSYRCWFLLLTSTYKCCSPSTLKVLFFQHYQKCCFSTRKCCHSSTYKCWFLLLSSTFKCWSSSTLKVLFFQHLQRCCFSTRKCCPSSSTYKCCLSAVFSTWFFWVYDSFYSFALGLLEEHYPERTITVTSRDPRSKRSCGGRTGWCAPDEWRRPER